MTGAWFVELAGILALDRQTGVLIALAALTVAAAVVAVGAWLLLRRHRREGGD